MSIPKRDLSLLCSTPWNELTFLCRKRWQTKILMSPFPQQGQHDVFGRRHCVWSFPSFLCRYFVRFLSSTREACEGAQHRPFPTESMAYDTSSLRLLHLEAPGDNISRRGAGFAATSLVGGETGRKEKETAQAATLASDGSLAANLNFNTQTYSVLDDSGCDNSEYQGMDYKGALRALPLSSEQKLVFKQRLAEMAKDESILQYLYYRLDIPPFVVRDSKVRQRFVKYIANKEDRAAELMHEVVSLSLSGHEVDGPVGLPFLLLYCCVICLMNLSASSAPILCSP